MHYKAVFLISYRESDVFMRITQAYTERGVRNVMTGLKRVRQRTLGQGR